MMTTHDATLPLNHDLPDWVLGLYDADDLPSMTVILPYVEGYWILREADFNAVNLYQLKKIEDIIGDDCIFEGTLQQAVDSVKAAGSTYVFTEKTRQHPEKKAMAMTAGFSSTLTKYSIVRWDYETFLRSVKKYEENPKDIAAVYEFLNHHPMFWRFEERSPSRVAPDVPRKPLILTGQGWDTIWLGMNSKKTKKGKTKTTVMLEAGGATVNRWHLYHDYNLDVYEPTLDKAFVKLAALIHKDYDEHGKLRDGREEPNDNFFKKETETGAVSDSGTGTKI